MRKKLGKKNIDRYTEWKNFKFGEKYTPTDSKSSMTLKQDKSKENYTLIIKLLKIYRNI